MLKARGGMVASMYIINSSTRRSHPLCRRNPSCYRSLTLPIRVQGVGWSTSTTHGNKCNERLKPAGGCEPYRQRVPTGVVGKDRYYHAVALPVECAEYVPRPVVVYLSRHRLLM